jgi:hypothetical protein
MTIFDAVALPLTFIARATATSKQSAECHQAFHLS